MDIATIGEDVPLLEGIRTTRAIRRLKTDPVPRALIRKVCEAGTFAPSGGNRQPWRFIAVTEPERRAWVAERYRTAFHAYIAPAVAAARDPAYPEAQRKNLRAALQALFPAVQNILLACRAVGLGASLTTVHLAFGRELDAWLELPETCPTCAMLPIGWPRGGFWRPLRRSVDTCLSWERYAER